MSTASQASLGALRIQARQRSDMENNFAVSDAEFNQYISQSTKELFDHIVAAYGNDYFVAPYYQFVTTNSLTQSLPDGTPNYLDINGNTAKKVYKLLGVDLQSSSSASGWLTLKRFELIERNKDAVQNVYLNANTNLKYRPNGDNILWNVIPNAGQTIRLMYIPAPNGLQFLLPCTMTVNSTILSLPDTTGIQVGMQVYGQGIQPNTVVTAVTPTSVTLSLFVTNTNVSAMLYFWSDATTIDGIAGWEEFVVIDAAMKAQIKQENDYSALATQKAAMIQRIQAMAEGRDAGQACHVSDVLNLNGFGDECGWGSGYGY